MYDNQDIIITVHQEMVKVNTQSEYTTLPVIVIVIHLLYTSILL